MAKKQSGKGERRVPKTVLRLPDLDQAKSAVLNSLSSVELRPTHMERTAWGEGNVEGLTVVETPFGVVGGLCSWEHVQPLNRQGMMQLGEQIHVASWPGMGMFRGVPGFHALSVDASQGEDASYARESPKSVPDVAIWLTLRAHVQGGAILQSIDEGLGAVRRVRDINVERESRGG